MKTVALYAGAWLALSLAVGVVAAKFIANQWDTDEQSGIWG